MSRAQRRGTNSDIGHLAERRAAEWLGDRIGLVPDRPEDVPAQNCLDGVFLRPVVGDIAGEIIDVGTPLEVKAVAYRTTDQQTSRRGRVQIRRYAHEWLLEADGEYAVLVYDQDSLEWDDDRITDIGAWHAARLVPASVVDSLIDTWTKDGLDDVARIPWSRLMDPDRVSADQTPTLVADGGCSRSSGGRTHRARIEPLAADRLDVGVFEVRNLASDTHYRVDISEPTCECEDFQYTVGPAGETCKHIQFIEQVSTGELCPACGYAMCRPSCPERAAGLAVQEAISNE